MSMCKQADLMGQSHSVCLPDLSTENQQGLKKAGYEEPTEIQKQAIKPGLEGKDVVAAAKTGSGKTLAFIIPLLECLHKEKFSSSDGLGALVITPTRELAYQIFEVLRVVGQRHQFSAALVIGGKDLAMERKRIDQMNIIICTPGRMQQHMEENPLFYGDNLKMLIIDEADRILDMGFRESLDAIVDFLPKERQCLLFSATQTKSVKDIVRLSMRNPVEIDIDSNDTTVTPESLRQKFTVINLEQKLSFLYAFIKRHKKSKILVFIATCKQTKFLHDLFCRMKPGISINALHGGIHQLKRIDIYNKFHDVRHCCLLATDVAARGLDFPDVDWVVQFDCPADVNTYIHRVGRTARLERPGRSIMVLMPNEHQYMVERLANKKIPIEEVPTRDKHLFWVEDSIQSILARDVELKEAAKRTFTAYIKSLMNSHFRQMFDAKQLNLAAYAKSLGLEVTPRLRVLERLSAGKKSKTADSSEQEAESDGDLSTSRDLRAPPVSSDDDDEDLLKPAKKQRLLPDVKDEADIKREMLENKKLSRSKLAKLVRKKDIKLNKHVIFSK